MRALYVPYFGYTSTFAGGVSLRRGGVCDSAAKLHFEVVYLDLFSKQGDNKWHHDTLSNPAPTAADREFRDTDGPSKSKGLFLRGVSERVALRRLPSGKLPPPCAPTPTTLPTG